MKKELLIEKAKKLREKGYSYNEISNQLGISKSTASAWLKNVKLTNKAKERISQLQKTGREKSLVTIKNNRLKIFSEIEKNCTALLGKRKEDTDLFKVYLSLLYWGEGAKTGRRLMFINSDPEMIKTFMFLLRKSFKIDEKKFRAVLHLHEYHKELEMKKYWSRVTKISKDKISIYKKGNTGKRKKEDYRGCLSVRYGDSRILDEIFIIIKRFKIAYK